MRSLTRSYTPNQISVEKLLAEILKIPIPAQAPEPEAPAQAPVENNLEFLTLHNVGGHDVLQVARDIFRAADGKQTSKTPYNHVVYAEQQGLFIPSFALSCNILAALFKGKDNPDAKAVLDQYKDKGNGDGWHAQNTLINYMNSEIIHYPSAADFNATNPINLQQNRIVLPFDKSVLEDALLKDALKTSSFADYVQKLTGLDDPSILVDIGKYFGRPAKVWFPWTGKNGVSFKEKRVAWLGCGTGSLDLGSYDDLSSNSAARGVRRVGERSEPGAGGAV
ncbi:hypothetical protein HZA98_03920 [Candidatus Woesearchaeota archaeon]|nr:hypothetical protein [Candidatus Woesearchaeota archaeon]